MLLPKFKVAIEISRNVELDDCERTLESFSKLQEAAQRIDCFEKKLDDLTVREFKELVEIAMESQVVSEDTTEQQMMVAYLRNFDTYLTIISEMDEDFNKKTKGFMLIQ